MVSASFEYSQEEHEELERIIREDDIYTVFQPIVNLRTGAILGYEALSRCQSPLFKGPQELFEAARNYNRLWDLELACRNKALMNYSRYRLDSYLFLNVDPHVINDEKFKSGFTLEFLRQYGIGPSKLVLEITERSYINNGDLFTAAVNHYKSQNYSIAIDDAGSGYSGLNLIAELQPRYIKLDMNLVRNINKSKLKSALISAMQKFADDCNVALIAEGIENVDELTALLEIGVHYGQGYFLARPAQELPRINEPALAVLETFNNHKRYDNSHAYFSIGNIALPGETLSIHDKCQLADQIFRSSDELYGIAVLDGSRVAGLLSRISFYARLASQYGYSLYTKRSVTLIMDKDPLVVDYYTDIDVVSAIAVERSMEKIYNSILVTRNGEYYGTLTIRDILEKVSELKIETAKQLNPLTSLPGNATIQKRLAQLMDHPTDKEIILYIDIDYFKIYNDTYGVLKGDQFIQFVASCIQHAFDDLQNMPSFVGHIGGDDFIAVTKREVAWEIGNKIIEQFEQAKPSFYDEETLKKAYITARDRDGYIVNFPLCTLSIAGISPSSNGSRTIYELTEAAASVKKRCKAVKGNAIIIA